MLIVIKLVLPNRCYEETGRIRNHFVTYVVANYTVKIHVLQVNSTSSSVFLI